MRVLPDKEKIEFVSKSVFWIQGHDIIGRPVGRSVNVYLVTAVMLFFNNERKIELPDSRMSNSINLKFGE